MSSGIAKVAGIAAITVFVSISCFGFMQISTHFAATDNHAHAVTKNLESVSNALAQLEAAIPLQKQNLKEEIAKQLDSKLFQALQLHTAQVQSDLKETAMAQHYMRDPA